MNERDRIGGRYSPQMGRSWRSAPCSPMKPIATKHPPPRADSFHVIHKVPVGDSPYVRAKHVQLVDKDPNKAISLFWAAINCGDRVDSALKDMAIVMKQLDRAEEAIEAVKSFRNMCSYDAQESLDNVLLDLYKRCCRVDEQIELLQHKLKLIEEGVAFSGKKTKIARSQGKKFHVTIDSEKARLLGNLAWAYLQKDDYHAAEALYRKGLTIDPDKNKQCNLAVCLMHTGRIAEAKSIIHNVRTSPTVGDENEQESHVKSYERACEILSELERPAVASPTKEKKEKKRESQKSSASIGNGVSNSPALLNRNQGNGAYVCRSGTRLKGEDDEETTQCTHGFSSTHADKNLKTLSALDGNSLAKEKEEKEKEIQRSSASIVDGVSNCPPPLMNRNQGNVDHVFRGGTKWKEENDEEMTQHTYAFPLTLADRNLKALNALGGNKDHRPQVNGTSTSPASVTEIQGPRACELKSGDNTKTQNWGSCSPITNGKLISPCQSSILFGSFQALDSKNSGGVSSPSIEGNFLESSEMSMVDRWSDMVEEKVSPAGSIRKWKRGPSKDHDDVLLVSNHINAKPTEAPSVSNCRKTWADMVEEEEVLPTDSIGKWKKGSAQGQDTLPAFNPMSSKLSHSPLVSNSNRKTWADMVEEEVVSPTDSIGKWKTEPAQGQVNLPASNPLNSKANHSSLVSNSDRRTWTDMVEEEVSPTDSTGKWKNGSVQGQENLPASNHINSKRSEAPLVSNRDRRTWAEIVGEEEALRSQNSTSKGGLNSHFSGKLCHPSQGVAFPKKINPKQKPKKFDGNLDRRYAFSDENLNSNIIEHNLPPVSRSPLAPKQQLLLRSYTRSLHRGHDEQIDQDEEVTVSTGMDISDQKWRNHNNSPLLGFERSPFARRSLSFDRTQRKGAVDHSSFVEDHMYLQETDAKTMKRRNRLQVFQELTL